MQTLNTPTFLKKDFNISSIERKKGFKNILKEKIF